MKKKRGQDESAGRSRWRKLSEMIYDRRILKDNSMSERKGLQDGSESCYDIWF